MQNKKNIAIIIMGVSGAGKSTIGKLLSVSTNIPFYDGDDFHPEENIKKMASGVPLNDEDRGGWLLQLNALIKKNIQTNSCILACSALKAAYRIVLEKGIEDNVKFVYLFGSYESILNRLLKRTDHFLPASLLRSQFETLDPPLNSIEVSILKNPEEIVAEIQKRVFEIS